MVRGGSAMVVGDVVVVALVGRRTSRRGNVRNYSEFYQSNHEVSDNVSIYT